MIDLNYLKKNDKNIDKNTYKKNLLEISGGGKKNTPKEKTTKSVNKIKRKSAQVSQSSQSKNSPAIKVIQYVVTLLGRQKSMPNENVEKFQELLGYLYEEYKNDKFFINTFFTGIINVYRQDKELLNIDNINNNSSFIKKIKSYINNKLLIHFNKSDNGYFLTFFFKNVKIVFSFHPTIHSISKNELDNRYHIKLYTITNELEYMYYILYLFRDNINPVSYEETYCRLYKEFRISRNKDSDRFNIISKNSEKRYPQFHYYFLHYVLGTLNSVFLKYKKPKPFHE